VSPVIIDQDESETKEQLEQIQAENEAQKQQIEELMESVKEQQEEVSALKAIIMKLQAFFDSLFG
jgi:cell division septum initiation protein DivIVA